MGKVKAAYPGMSDAAAADVADSRIRGANKELLTQADKLEASLAKQKDKAAQISEEYQKQEDLIAGLNARHGELETQLQKEQSAASAMAKKVSDASDTEKTLSRVSSSFEKFGTRLRRIVSSALIFNVISSVLRSVVSVMGTAIAKTDGVSGALARMKGAVYTAAAGLAQVLAPAITWVLNLITSLASAVARLVSSLTGKSISAMKSQAKALNATGAAASKAARSLAGFDEIERLNSGSGSGGVSYDFENTSSPLDALSQKLKDFWTYFRRLIAPSIEAWSTAWDQIKSKAVAVLPAIKSAAQSLWTNGLSPLLSYLSTTFVPGIINSFSEAFAPITGDVIATAIQVFADFFVWACGIITDAINSILVPALDLVLHVWQGAMESIQAVWNEYGQTICDGIVEAFKNIENILTELWESFVRPVLQRITDLLRELWDTHLNPLWDDLLALVASVGNCLLTFWNSVISPLLSWILSTFSPSFTEAFNAIADGVETAVAFISDALDVAVIALKGVIDFLTAVFRGDWDAAWQAIGNTVTAVWDKVQNTVRSAINGIIGFINGMISAIVSGLNAVVSALNSLSFDIPDWVPGLGGSRFGFSIGTLTAPQIPYLAQGAVIPANREFLAVLGDQHSGTNVEAPLDTIKQAVAEVMEDLQAGQMAGFEAVVGVLREILSAVYGIELTDEDVGRAVQRWQRKQAIATGGV